jgi:hypothetical protein
MRRYVPFGWLIPRHATTRVGRQIGQGLEMLLKIRARIVETASRMKLALATACPQAELFRVPAGALQPAGPKMTGKRQRARALHHPTRQLQRVRKCGSTSPARTRRGKVLEIRTRIKSARRSGWVNKAG